jgi:hypothetical protein
VVAFGDELRILTGREQSECGFFAFKKLYLHEYADDS